MGTSKKEIQTIKEIAQGLLDDNIVVTDSLKVVVDELNRSMKKAELVQNNFKLHTIAIEAKRFTEQLDNLMYEFAVSIKTDNTKDYNYFWLLANFLNLNQIFTVFALHCPDSNLFPLNKIEKRLITERDPFITNVVPAAQQFSGIMYATFLHQLYEFYINQNPMQPESKVISERTLEAIREAGNLHTNEEVEHFGETERAFLRQTVRLKRILDQTFIRASQLIYNKRLISNEEIFAYFFNCFFSELMVPLKEKEEIACQTGSYYRETSIRFPVSITKEIFSEIQKENTFPRILIEWKRNLLTEKERVKAEEELDAFFEEDEPITEKKEDSFERKIEIINQKIEELTEMKNKMLEEV